MKHSFTILSFVLLLLSCVREDLDLAPQQSAPATDETKAYVSGEARVYFSEEMASMIESTLAEGSLETKSSALNGTINGLGIKEMYRLFPHAGEFEPRTRAEGLHRWYVVKYSEDVPHTKASVDFGQIEGVEIVEPVRRIRSTAVSFNDPRFNELWGFTSSEWSINVQPVWDMFTVGDPNVIVAIVDSGLDLDHEDLAANVLSSGHYNYAAKSSKVTAGDHGTHVAGTIAAVGNNGKGVAGIAGGDHANGNPGVKLLACQIFNADGTSAGDASANAIKSAADRGAVISQNSWGYVYDMDGDGKLSKEEKEMALAAEVNASDKAAIDYFIKYAGCDNAGNQLDDSPMKGGVVIFAAGNDAIENGAPANYDAVIAVGSIASSGNRSTFSNYGTWVDIAAPGTGILSTYPNNDYQLSDGTSMACPHVSGVAALVVSRFGGPGFTNDMLKDRLLKGANHDVLPSSAKIGSYLDAYGAMTYGSTATPEPVTDLEPSARANGIDLAFTVTADEDGLPAYGFMVLYGKNREAVEAATPKNRKDVETHTFVVDAAAGTQGTYLLKGLDFEQSYYLKMYAYSYNMNYSDPTEVMEVTTGVNRAPIITIEAKEVTLKAFEKAEIPVSIVEPDGHELVYYNDSDGEETPLTLYVNGSKADSFKKDDEGYKIVISAQNASAGVYRAVVEAKDEYGMVARTSFQYTILPNNRPEILKEIDDILMTGKGEEVILDMSEYVFDEDGETPVYEFEYTNNRIVYAYQNVNKLYITALNYGDVDVKVISYDAKGESCYHTFKVVVKDPAEPVSLYPNPFQDYLNVSTMAPADTRVQILNSSGKKVYDETMIISAIEPVKLDLRDLAPGVYSVKVSFDGKEYVRNVVKL